MSDDSDGAEILDNIISDLEKTEELLERAEVITEQATNRLRIYRDRYDGGSPPMPPNERDFHEGSGNKDVYSGPPEESKDE